MNPEQFRTQAHLFADWMADYLARLENYPVKAQTKPGEISAQLDQNIPAHGEPLERIFEDFKRILLPGMTHWQHPGFFAYFPGNASPVSVLAEMLTAALAAQCMSWQTSPAATELETRVLEWLRDLLGLPTQFSGVIQDTASAATLCALLSARERATDYRGNTQGLHRQPLMTVYCSREAHSSVDKAVKIAGLGQAQLRKIAVDERFAMQTAELEKQIETDQRNGYRPLCVVATLGTTGVGAIDPLAAIGKLCRRYGLWLHVDAAWAGSALLLPEHRHMLAGAENIDSLVINPHKWLLTQLDCSAYFVQDAQTLIRSLGEMPEYLKTREDAEVINYRDWGIALGRRFRALKLWFVMRYYGVEGLQQHLRKHLEAAQWLAAEIDAHPHFELLAPRSLALVCFRYHPSNDKHIDLDAFNARLLHALNDSGHLYLTHTKINGQYALRMAIGGVYTQQTHVDAAWQRIKETTTDLAI